MKPNTAPVAPLALVPNVPTKAVSTRLYTLVISMGMIAGTASETTSLETDSLVMRACFASLSAIPHFRSIHKDHARPVHAIGTLPAMWPRSPRMLASL